MTNSVTIAFDVVPTQPNQPLAFSVIIDDAEVWHTDALTESQTLSFAVNDDEEREHRLCWVLSGKTDQHTAVDSNGNIVSDSMIRIENLRMDEIEISSLIDRFCVYQHNLNGHGDAVEEKFYGNMGCNGTTTLKFTSPLYLWLLENM